MNLVYDPWITVKDAHGNERCIAPWQIAVEDIEAVDIAAPRPDFRGALYQFLIGLMQGTLAPFDMQDWAELYDKPPSPQELKQAFSGWADAFELDAKEGPAFLQDFDRIDHADPVEIAKLLVDTPGDKTTADNNDLFLHAGGVRAMCPRCVAMALLTLQINAPSGGAGHRVSLRGGGPLTTLRIPRQPDASLWQKLWSNVLPVEGVRERKAGRRELILPWLAPTRTSEKGQITTPEDVHPMQAFWSMPRRIRLDFAGAAAGVCDVCGGASDRCITRYRTRPNGQNYGGAWKHPLTPYKIDPKQGDLPLSVKGQVGGIGYRDWLGLTIGTEDRSPEAAEVVRFFCKRADLPEQAREARLWCFGYDFDNMKSRCYYDASLPLPTVHPDDLVLLREAVKAVLDAAGDLAFAVRRSVAVAVTPGEAANPAVSQSFWERSERTFYSFLQDAMAPERLSRESLADSAEAWIGHAGRIAIEVFDAWVLTVPFETERMRDVVEARTGLQKVLYRGKCKELRTWAERQKKVAAV